MMISSLYTCTLPPAHLVGAGAVTEQVQGLALPHRHLPLWGVHNLNPAPRVPDFLEDLIDPFQKFLPLPRDKGWKYQTRTD